MDKTICEISSNLATKKQILSSGFSTGGSGGTGGTFNHNLLDNRDMANQHPITAITGLTEYVDNAISLAIGTVLGGEF